MQFIKGKAEIKHGRKIVAKIFDRKEFFKGTRYENSFTQFPYSVETMGGSFQCKDMNEVETIINKYVKTQL